MEEHAASGISTLIAPAVNVAILIAVFFKYLRGPAKEFARVRHETLRTNIEGAKSAMSKAQESFNEYSSKLKAIQTELSAMNAEAKTGAESARTNVVQNAGKIAAGIIKDATSARDGMLSEFKAELSLDLATRVVERAESMLLQRLTGDERARLRKEFSRKLEAAR